MAKGFNLDYWHSKGFKDEDIFDFNTGQPKPGWHRGGSAEGGGYVADAWPDGLNYEPIPTGGDHGPGTLDFGNMEQPTFNDWPSYSAPAYLSPDYISTPAFDPGPAFTYDSFNAPNPSEVGKDPAYQFRFDQGLKALGSNRAAQGTFLSGATGKALQDYGQNAASQEYDNIWNRSLQSYDTNRSNAFNNWASQYGQRKDAYGSVADENAKHNQFNLSDTSAHNQFNQSNAQFGFSGQQQQALAKFGDLFSRWKSQGDWLSQLAQEPT